MNRLRYAGWWLTAGWIICPGCWAIHRHTDATRRQAWQAARRCPVGYCYWGPQHPAFAVRDLLAKATRRRAAA